MPEKVRETKVEGTELSVDESEYTLDRVKLYAEDCGEPDEDLPDIANNLTLSRTFANEWRPAEELLIYGNSGYRTYNHCFHTKATTASRGSLQFINTEVVDNPRPTECDDTRSHKWCPVYNYRKHHIIEVHDPYVVTSLLGNTGGINTVCGEYLQNATIFESKMVELAIEAIDTMVPRLDDGFSMPRFLFELFELKQLYRSGLRFLQIIRDICGTLLRHPLRILSENYLATIFGIMPLISDTKTIFGKFLELENKVDQFLEGTNKRHTYYFEKRLADETFDPEYTWLGEHSVSHTLESSDPNDRHYYARDILGESPVIAGNIDRSVKNLMYHATMEFSYSVPRLDAGLKRMFAELDHWGINLSISDVWEVIPFSFVVDWVYDVGSWLQTFDLENLPVKVEIRKFSQSLKWTEQQKLSSLELIGFGPASATVGASRRDSIYCRWPGSFQVPEDEQGNPYLRTPNGKQLVIAAALLATRAPRRPQR